MTRGVGGQSPANIMKHLKGIHFGTTGLSKEAILAHAKQANGVDTKQIIEHLKKLPATGRYHTFAEIIKAISKKTED